MRRSEFSVLRLIRPFGADDAFINGLAAGESFFRAVPVGNGGFSHFPAQQYDMAFDLARKIEQANVDIFDLDSDGVDLGEGVFGALFGLGTLRFAAGHGHDVDVGAAVEEDAVSKSLHFGFDFFHDLLAADGRAQKRFEHRKQSLSFVESESSIAHGG